MRQSGRLISCTALLIFICVLLPNQLASGAHSGLPGRSLLGTDSCPNSQFGVDFQGSDMPNGQTDNVASPEACCTLCGNTPSCVAFTWVAVDGTHIPSANDPMEGNDGAVVNRCYLKNALGPATNSDFTVSGKLQQSSGTVFTPAYRPPLQVLFHSQDEPDSAAKPAEAFFLPQGGHDANNLPDVTGTAVPLVFLLSQPNYSATQIKQVDWYIHKPTTAFTDPNAPPVPSQMTTSTPPFYLGTKANAAGGQGPTYDIQQLRLGSSDSCGLPGSTAGTFCTATAVVTFKDGTKAIGARNTFRADILHSEG